MFTSRAAAPSSTTTTTTTDKKRRHNNTQEKKKQQRRVQQQNRQLLYFGILFMIIFVIFLPNGTNGLPVTADTDDRSIEIKRYCSNNLSDAIHQICGGRYNSLSRKFPESVSGHGGAIRSLQSLTTDEEYYRPLTNGPIHECCKRPCGYMELRTYCAPID